MIDNLFQRYSAGQITIEYAASQSNCTPAQFLEQWEQWKGNQKEAKV